MVKNEKLKETELDSINGGNEPEEFDWHAKGYTTPVKDDSTYKGWHFDAIGDNSNKYDRVVGKHTIGTEIVNKNND